MKSYPVIFESKRYASWACAGDANLERELWVVTSAFWSNNFTIHDDTNNDGKKCVDIIQEYYPSVFKDHNPYKYGFSMLPIKAGTSKIEYYNFPENPEYPGTRKYWLLNPPVETIMTRK